MDEFTERLIFDLLVINVSSHHFGAYKFYLHHIIAVNNEFNAIKYK